MGVKHMSREGVIHRIINILRNNLAEADEIVINEVMISEALQVNSLVFLQLLTEIEKEFQIHIDDDYWEYEKLNSIDKIADYVIGYSA